MSFFNRVTILNFANAAFSYWAAQKAKNDFLALPASIIFGGSCFFLSLVIKHDDEGVKQSFKISAAQNIPAAIGHFIAVISGLRVQQMVPGIVAITGLIFAIKDFGTRTRSQPEFESSHESYHDHAFLGS